MAVAGLIFSNIHNAEIPELTSVRTMASLPFGCRYRLIDFPLSNMVNSGITKVGIIAHNNYQSLMDHIGTGKDWDLARRSGGIKILPPFITTYDGGSNRLYRNRLEALMGVTNFISRCTEEHIVLSDCDFICNLDLNDVIEDHKAKNADMTMVTRTCIASEKLPLDGVAKVKVDDSSMITDIEMYRGGDESAEVSTNIMVFNRLFLLGIIEEAVAHGYKQFYQQLLMGRLGAARVNAYHYEGVYLHITSLASYFDASMQLLKPEVRQGLFNKDDRAIYTKLRNSAPTVYAEGSKVTNSYVADGCVIEGTVENSIIFRGVHVSRGAVVKNSILLQDTYVGAETSLNCVITDKNVVIREGRNLSGHESMPFFLSKGSLI